ncbi:sigma-70 family RNA polymerase sigma factor [Streptomyces bikiniensis]|uniref:sigma-70 family RNA polymerase sigma factor n=1 Tax=Streptomyces bikiniensis TaxID=1896 RepID=UPI0004C2A33F|nr:sigma-70 family RNA polymerase sigma factor [Streptomyces bikiniensis]
MSTQQLTELVRAAQSGDPQAQDRLLTHHLPLVYNIVGRAMNGHHDVDDVVQETMLRALGGLGDLRAPDSFRSWLVAIAMNVVRTHWHRQQNGFVTGGLDDARDLPQPGADFVGLTVVRLNLSGQRRETAEATRWLEPDDRALLSLWWLECTGDLTRYEVASALQLSPEHTAVRVQRMKAQLDAARVVVRALTENPPCPDLRYELGGWDGRPSGLWRKRIARHARACVHCAGLSHGLYPAEGLLAGLLLVPPAGLLLASFRERAGLDLATATAPLGGPAYAPHSYEPNPYEPNPYEPTGTSGYGHEYGHGYGPTGTSGTPGDAHEPAATAGSAYEAAEPAPYTHEPVETAAYEAAGAPGTGPSPVVGARSARNTRRRRRQEQQRGRRRVAIAAGMAVAAVTGGAFTLVDGPDEDELTALDAPRASTVDLTVSASAPASSPSASTASASVTPTATPSGTPRPSRTVSATPSARPTASAPTAAPTTASQTVRPTADRPVHKPTQAPVTKRPTAPSSPTATKQDSGHTSVEEQVIALVNAERAKEGCGAVTGNSLLARAAQGHSDDMAARDFFDHTNPDGAGPGERVTATGYGWSTYGENIAMGQRTAEQVMEAWMNSPGHRANILNCSFKELGVGLHTGDGGPYWTQVFGAR